jgi:hypothetical protein
MVCCVRSAKALQVYHQATLRKANNNKVIKTIIFIRGFANPID